VTWVDAADASLPDESIVTVEAGEVTAVVARAQGAWHAVDAWCTHEECPLGDGWIEEGAIRCECHGALFDLASGAVLEGPAFEPVAVYPTRIVGDRVEVELP
jgi:nitrite reductase/ring-hydroxylating ferredoxin subunit